MSLRNLRYASTREPALRPDGRPYAEHMRLRAADVRVGDIVTEVGTVMKVETAKGNTYLAGRLLHRDWPSDKIVDVVRRNWEEL
jgi:hypothetical protein